jgi:hypothetical protein
MSENVGKTLLKIALVFYLVIDSIFVVLIDVQINTLALTHKTGFSNQLQVDFILENLQIIESD